MIRQDWINKNIAAFETALRCRFDSEATRKNYLTSASRFIEWAAYKKGDQIDLIKQYLAWGLKSKSGKTHNLHRDGICSFFKLVKDIRITVAMVPRKKEGKTLPKIIDQETITRAILKTNNLQHRLIVSILYGCGLRLSEAQHLKVSSIIKNRDVLKLVNTKGNRGRIVPIPGSMKDALYEHVVEKSHDDYVFENLFKGGILTKRTIGKIVERAFERVGSKCSPHQLRHSFATDLTSNGTNLRLTQSWLGHSSVRTTEIYAHLSDELLAEGVDLLECNKTYKKGNM